MAPATLERDAALKILLHAAKYPHFAVNGILIGKLAGKSGEVRITDAIPVIHNYTTLTPPFEAALFQAHAHSTASGFAVLGYYQANELLNDVDLGSVGKRVADRVASLAPAGAPPLAVVLDGKALGKALRDAEVSASSEAGDDAAAAGKIQSAFRALGKDGKSWTRAEGGLTLQGPARVLADLASFVEEGRHRRLVDFEDHLDDLHLDWFNPLLLA